MQNNNNNNVFILSFLPCNVWHRILSLCDDRTLCCFAQSCRWATDLTCSDELWRSRLKWKRISPIGCDRAKYNQKSLYEAACAWSAQRYSEHSVIAWKARRVIPWIYIEETALWLSRGPELTRYRLSLQKSDLKTRNYSVPIRSLNRRDDLCRFRVDNSVVVAGTRAGSLIVRSPSFSGTQRNDYTIRISNAHSCDIHDVHLKDDLVASGSRDGSIKLWRINTHLPYVQQMSGMMVQDRVWSLAGDEKQLYVGTAACRNDTAPISVWNIERAKAVAELNKNCKLGAGTLCLQLHSKIELLSGGYDGTMRVWDLRINECVESWDEMYDNAIFSMASDSNNVILLGASRCGLIWTYDRRQRKPIQRYYIKNAQESPVYGLAFNSWNAFAAMDRQVIQLSF